MLVEIDGNRLSFQADLPHRRDRRFRFDSAPGRTGPSAETDMREVW